MAELIIALDVNSPQKAINLVNELENTVKWLKIGLELFIYGGPELVKKLSGRGYNIFLDLKFYDIPNTVAHAVKATAHLGITMLTLHCQGGAEMCAAALNAAKPDQILLGVTALTSFADGQMPGINHPVSNYAEFLASEAWNWGLPGVVCSAWEAAKIKKHNPGLICVCPGIRPANSENADQNRVATPQMAVKAGADFLVCGRPVIMSANPRQAALDILAEIS